VPQIDPTIGYSIIIGFVLLFATAAVHKLYDLAHFTEIFAAYHLLPESVGRRLAWLVPCVELVVAICLLSGAGGRPRAVLVAMAVLVAYAGGLGINLGRGRRDLDCGCGAARGRRSIASWMVWRNVFLAVAVGFAALPWTSRALDGADLLTILGTVTVGALLYATVDRLLGDVIPGAIAPRRTS